MIKNILYTIEFCNDSSFMRTNKRFESLESKLAGFRPNKIDNISMILHAN